MKKFLLFLAFFASFSCPCFSQEELLSVSQLKKMDIVANSDISLKELERAKKIIFYLQKQNLDQIEKGYGPFLAVIYNQKGYIIAQTPNTVVKDKCSICHAEMNAIKEAQRKLGTYDLSRYHLSIYVTAEPCIMCAGGIMWSGIENIYYGVPSKDVERITGFDEGYKPNWVEEFKKRNIKVYGNIESDFGKDVLRQYVKTNKEIYKPSR